MDLIMHLKTMKSGYLILFFAISAIIGLYIASRENYLLFHTIVKLVSIIIAGPSYPILVISGFGTTETISNLTNLGCSFLEKPFSPEEFLGVVKALLYKSCRFKLFREGSVGKKNSTCR
ncbi:MAG: hypothetical protein KAU17_13095 [Spirochaetales bacterium]|nr:hypothetical protein [Spirochaetales bacterium]